MWITSLFVALLLFPCYHSTVCTESDLHIETSKCTPDGHRWIFEIPHPNNTCKLTNSSLPRLISGCDKSCSPGRFLNLRNEKCEACQPGSYSNGEHLIFDEWKHLPEEFSVDKTYDISFVHDNCSRSSWTGLGKHIRGKATAGCAITLSLKMHSLKRGEVSFTYNIERFGTMAFFTVRNAHCSQLPSSSFLLHYTGANVYADLLVQLPTGDSILQWYLFADRQTLGDWTTNSLDDAHFLRLGRVNISGTPPLFHCPPCPPGTYSDRPGAVTCSPCPENTYSNRQKCIPCPNDEYSMPGSASCTIRQACKTDDYMEFWTPCDASGHTRKQWRWIEPMICNNNTGVKLPQNEKPIACQACPIGTELDEAGSCKPCREGYISDPATKTPCHSCPDDRVPVFGILYSTWSRIPRLLKTFCCDDLGITCSSTWRLAGSHITAGPDVFGTSVACLDLNLVSGFISTNYLNVNAAGVVFVPAVPDTYIRFEFETICVGQCLLSFTKTDSWGKDYSVVEWVGSQARQNYTFPIEDSRPAKFSWTFRASKGSNSKVTSMSTRQSNKAMLYRLEVTNLAKSSAVGCRTCLNGIRNGRCIPCPPGLFYHTTTANATSHESVLECINCPSDSIPVSDALTARSVSEACVKCEPGTKPVNSSVCVVDSNPTTNTGITYNLSRLLNTEQSVDGVKLFTPSGTPYYHQFHLTLGYGKTVHCTSDWVDKVQGITSVQSAICRHTAVRLSTGTVVEVHTKPLSLGDRLVRAVPSNHSKQFWNDVNKNLTRAGWKTDDVGGDFHYIFETYESTRSCPRGRMSIVTLRCSVFGVKTPGKGPVNPVATTHSLGTVEVPPNCPDGTCDGCTYHFLWTSPVACRICAMNDFIRFPGECQNGRQTYFLIPGYDCVIGGGKSGLTEVLPCPYLSRPQLVAIVLVALIMGFLSIVICICYRRNKRLEYKYMKLVQITEGTQARVTSCALDEFGSVDNVDGFGRRALPPQISAASRAHKSSEQKNIHFTEASSMHWPVKGGLTRMQLPKLGPVVFKSRADPDGQTLPENEITG